MKLRLIAAAVAALALTAGNAVAQDTSTEKGKLSYALGYDLGRNAIESGEAVDVNAIIKGLQDGVAKKQPAVPVDQLRTAVQNMQKRQAEKAKAEWEKAAATNKTKSDTYIAANKAKAGVKSLPSGVQYRVIEAGNGAKPTQANQITLEFRGTLPDGTVTADTGQAFQGQPAGPVTVRLSEIPMPGLREALQLMPQGARWEVVMPGSAAHGTSVERAGEMANQVVIFDIRLVNVGPALPASPSGG